MRRLVRRRFPVAAAAVLAVAIATLLPASPAVAGTEDFHLVAQRVLIDNVAGTATFKLEFDRAPRFFLPHGGGGDQPNAFQVEIDADHNTFDRPLDFNDLDTIVRGAEIFRGHGLPIREREGDGGPASGGWGPVRTLVPFDVDGSSLTFTAPLASLGDTDGRFRYRVITTEGGAMTSEIHAAIIPLPAGVWTGLVLLGAAGVATRLKMRLS